MVKLKNLLICPRCKCSLSEDLKCNKCGKQFSYNYGVFNMVMPELSGVQNKQWDLNIDTMDRHINILMQKEKEDESIKDYNRHKNQETIDAQKRIENI